MQKREIIASNEASRGGKRFISSGLTLAFLATVAFSLSIGQELYTHPAHAANEVITNSSDSESFANPQLLRTLTGHTGTIKSLNFSPSGKLLVSGGAENDPIIRFWNPQTGKKLGMINRACE